jgi:hypothetical protein
MTLAGRLGIGLAGPVAQTISARCDSVGHRTHRALYPRRNISWASRRAT